MQTLYLHAKFAECHVNGNEGVCLPVLLRQLFSPMCVCSVPTVKPGVHVRVFIDVSSGDSLIM